MDSWLPERGSQARRGLILGVLAFVVLAAALVGDDLARDRLTRDVDRDLRHLEAVLPTVDFRKTAVDVVDTVHQLVPGVGKIEVSPTSVAFVLEETELWRSKCLRVSASAGSHSIEVTDGRC